MKRPGIIFLTDGMTCYLVDLDQGYRYENHQWVEDEEVTQKGREERLLIRNTT